MTPLPTPTEDELKSAAEEAAKQAEADRIAAAAGTGKPFVAKDYTEDQLKSAAGEASKEGAFKLGKEGKLFANVGADQAENLTKLEGLHKKAVDEKLAENIVAERANAVSAAKKALLETKNKAHGKLGVIDKTMAEIGGNFGEKGGGLLMKGIRGGVAIGSMVVVANGAKNLVAPERDENGERKGSVWKQIGKIGAGLAAIYFSLTMGGKNKAMGLG